LCCFTDDGEELDIPLVAQSPIDTMELVEPPKAPSPVPLHQSQRIRCPPECFQNNYAKGQQILAYQLSTMMQATRIAMLLNWDEDPKCLLTQHFDALCEQETCNLSWEMHALNPLHFHVKLQESDLDDPTFSQVMSGDLQELKFWYDTIDAKLLALHEKACFKVVPKSEAEGQQIVKSTWAFKQKRRPDGYLLKYKACLCMHGNQMYEGLNEGEDTMTTSGYAPIIDWGTLHIILNVAAQDNLYLIQVDFKNAFVQAPLDRPMYMSSPPGFSNIPQFQDKVLHLD